MTPGVLKIRDGDGFEVELQTSHSGMDVEVAVECAFEALARYHAPLLLRHYCKPGQDNRENILGFIRSNCALERLQYSGPAAALIISAYPCLLEPVPKQQKADRPDHRRAVLLTIDLGAGSAGSWYVSDVGEWLPYKTKVIDIEKRYIEALEQECKRASEVMPRVSDHNGENYIASIRRPDGSIVRVLIPVEGVDCHANDVVADCDTEKEPLGLNLISDGHYE